MENYKKKILFVLNPNAGKGLIRTLKTFIHREVRFAGMDYDIVCKKNMVLARQIIIENAESYDMVVSVGGDGTNYFVLNALMETNQRHLGILPAGTANDFAKCMRIKGSHQKVLRNILNHDPVIIDIGKADHRYFLNTASMGFDVGVMKTYDALPRPKLGKVSYLYSIFKNLITYEKERFQLSFLNQKEDKEYLLFVLANGIYYGGGFPIVPPANPMDGVLDLVTVFGLSNTEVVGVLPKLLQGKHLALKEYVDHHKVENLEIGFHGEGVLNLDGELFPVKEPVHCKIVPGEIYLYGQ
ncbi:MAG: diacylglycerol kinase family lipid kinase [Tissierellia bacterium]|nr:diacylglycerol kinase family lipid kinase [Tissierellia bacterium]